MMAKEKITAKKSDGLLEQLKNAVAQTCGRMGWALTIERETETFCKIVTVLPTKESPRPLVAVNVSFDLQTRGGLSHLSRTYDLFLPINLKESFRQESDTFVKALSDQIGMTLKQWVQQHPKDREKILYLLALENTLPAILAHPLKDRRERVRELKLKGTSQKEIAKDIKESEDVVKKDLEWLRRGNYLPKP
jgi:hypothetical protein